jgi:hypothetical protein
MSSNFFKFLIFLLELLRKFLAFWKNGVQHPHFLKLALALGSIKFSIPHGDWRFYFFLNFIFPKFRLHMDLHIHRWDFCLKKIESTKNSTRIAIVMESFGTLP